MSRRLIDLKPSFQPKACLLIARIIEAQIPIMIVDTLRTEAEHQANLRAGVSWTKRSKHLTGRAIDLALYQTWQLHGPDKLMWDPNDPAWLTIGEIGESLGLTWGGRWKQRDLGHFEEKDDDETNPA